MWSICKKELSQFFGNVSGYIAIVLFLVICGIYLFLLPESSILNNGFASLSYFFELAPWVLMFLVPAISMRIFSDEFKTGTFEILKTKPLSGSTISLGKYLAVLMILLISILPTIVYVFTIKHFSINGLIDVGEIIGSYMGLFLLAATFAAISLCCGSFTNNAIVAFLMAAFACLVLYFGFNAISQLPFFQGNADYYIDMLGIDFHYRNISRGVIDTRDVVYFLSLIVLCQLISINNLKRRTN